MAGRKKKKPARKTTAKSAAVAKVPQPHGGALNSGGTPGNKGGTGRPRSEVRDKLLASFDRNSLELIDSVVRGEVMSKARWPMISTVKYFKCKDCGGKNFTPDEAEGATIIDLLLVEIEVAVSASVRDRLAAIDMQAKYGLGTVKEITTDAVKDRLTKTLDKIQERCPPELYQMLMMDLKLIWTAT